MDNWSVGVVIFEFLAGKGVSFLEYVYKTTD